MRDPTEALNIVVLPADSTHFGLVVEEISDTQEIVVQPLSRQIKHVDAFAGATITGDGKVALILDIAGLSQRAHRQPGLSGSNSSSLDFEMSHEAEDWDANGMLICRVGEDRRIALPMGDIARLEEFPDHMVEHAGDAQVVQYRGDLLRLIHVGELLGMPTRYRDGTENYHVVVHRNDDESAVGLVVDQILDVVEEEVVLSEVGLRRPGLQGSAVIQCA